MNVGDSDTQAFFRSQFEGNAWVMSYCFHNSYVRRASWAKVRSVFLRIVQCEREASQGRLDRRPSKRGEGNEIPITACCGSCA